MQYNCNIGKQELIRSESGLSSIEGLLEGFTEQIMKIPYAATWGSSCQGHFEDLGASALLHPYGIISIIMCPEIRHIKDLQHNIFMFRKKYEGINIRSTEKQNIGKHNDFSKIIISPVEIKKSSIIGFTKDNYSIINLIIEQHDNGSMGPEFMPSVKIPIKKNSQFYKTGKMRYKQIERNWLSMASEIENYCNTYKFLEPDFSKKELEPFCSLSFA